MNDPALTWLGQEINANQANQSVWCVDENILHQLPDASTWETKPLLISNRWDVSEAAAALGFCSQFSDFDFSSIKPSSLTHFFYRVSKEKPVVHHIINAAYQLLAPAGELFLCGQKNEGIKTYIEKAATLFGCTVTHRKIGNAYVAKLKKISLGNDCLLNDNDYLQLRPIATVDDLIISSKPGLFGWNKIDQGSELLITHLHAVLQQHSDPLNNLLDLGCGYGYLTLMSAKSGFTQVVLTDNNAAALQAARYNCDYNGVDAHIHAADAGDTLAQTFDVILCNPPFHQGFSVDGDLTDKFVAASKRLLARKGIALFVVNQFIPLERKASQYFTRVDLIVTNSSFKVIRLAH